MIFVNGRESRGNRLLITTLSDSSSSSSLRPSLVGVEMERGGSMQEINFLGLFYRLSFDEVEITYCITSAYIISSCYYKSAA